MDSDHDLLIRLSERMQQVLNDRLETNTRIAKIEIALEALQRERAALKFGWRMLIGVATACGSAAGFLAHFLLHR